jgi:uncharacterized membrane protein YphA (DoxX/SURF4 family)
MANLNPNPQKPDVQGRSMILNVVCIVLNLAGVFFVAKGYHSSAAESASLYKIIGFSLLTVSIGGLIILKGLFLYSYVARALVGGLFIVSGLIKANDPWGFAFKLGEYFEPQGLSYDFPFFEQFTPYALQLSILICVAEIVLGVAVIVGGKIKLAAWSLVIMMGFFTWLTWYTDSCLQQQLLASEQGIEFTRQCVDDCGCFGDALKGSVGRSLTPAESFWKDIVLFYFVLLIFISQWKIKQNTVKENWIMVPASLVVVIFFSWVFGWVFPVFFFIFTLLGAFVFGNLNIGSMAKAWKMAIFVTLVSFLFSLYTTMYMEIKDYRPYAIGNNIREEMNKEVPPVIEMIMQYKDKATGEIIDFKADEWAIYMDTTKYVFHDRIDKVIDPGVQSPIKDFRLEIRYNDLGEEDKKIAYIDSVIQSDYANYYEDRMALKTQWGNDTIAVMDYDTLYYPDSVYTVLNTFTALVNPDAPFTIDMTDFVLNSPAIFVMTIREIEEVEKDQVADMKAIYDTCVEMGIPFVVISPASKEQIEQFKADNQFNPLCLSIDGTEVKIIIRSNPGLVLLKSGTVVNKWPWRSVPDFDDIAEEHLQGLVTPAAE